MARGAAVAEGRDMRDAENELYERAAELVEAAAGIRRAAGNRHAARAVPALLACMEDALGNLADACAAFEELAAALEQARLESGAARALAARWGRDPHASAGRTP